MSERPDIDWIRELGRDFHEEPWWKLREDDKTALDAYIADLEQRLAQAEKVNEQAMGIIRRLAMNPDNAFALRAEAAALAEWEGK